MPRENKSQFAILGLLHFGPMSGYDMKKISDHSIGHFWNENYGNIYPVLKKMVSEGLVTMEKVDQDDAPARKVYTLTDAGRDCFTQWMGRSPEPSKLRDELLLQVFFGSWTGPDSIIAKLHEEKNRCSAIINELQEVKEHMESGDISEEKESEELREMSRKGTPYWKATVKFGLSYYRNIAEWCDVSLADMEALKEQA